MRVLSRLHGHSVIILLASVAIGLTACGRAGAPAPPSGTGATSPQSATPGGGPGSHVSPSSGTSTGGEPVPTAAGQLAAFYTAVAALDTRLHGTATLVNADIGASSMHFSPATLASVRALDAAPVARAIPASLPAGLLREVLTVYGDLESRTAAFHSVWEIGSAGRTWPVNSDEGKQVLRCLGNGGHAAQRFDSDLAAVRSLALSTPAVPGAAPASKASAELAVRIAYINLGDTCSESCGAYLPTKLVPVVWHREHDANAGRTDGTVDGIKFRADFHAESGWKVSIWAC